MFLLQEALKTLGSIKAENIIPEEVPVGELNLSDYHSDEDPDYKVRASKMVDQIQDGRLYPRWLSQLNS